MRQMILLCALVGLLLQVSYGAETVAFDTYFTGGLPFCTQCGTPGQYACSPDANGITLGNWNGGVINFNDPIPSGNYATKVVVTVYGAFSCNAVGGRAMFGISLNGQTHGVRDTSKGVNACKCDTCDGNEVFTFSFRNGVPNYRYRTSNSLKLELYKDSVCVNRVNVAITHDPVLTSPPTPLPEVYFNITIPKEYDRVGCPVCNVGLNQWCSASNNNTLQLSFKDPLPSNVYMISADLYISLNLIQTASTYLTTIAAKIQDTTVGTITVSESGWRDKCGCHADYQFQSALYQRGWPGYIAAGVNRVSFTANKYSQTYGNVCIGRLGLKLVYYQLSEDGSVAPELKSLFVEDVKFD